jgi:hypothetical protein
MGHLICIKRFEFNNNNFKPGVTYRFDEREISTILSKKYYSLHLLIRQCIGGDIKFSTSDDFSLADQIEWVRLKQLEKDKQVNK